MRAKKTDRRKNSIFYNGAALIKKCGLNLVVFELLYKLTAFAVLYPLFLLGMDFTLKKAGFRYLTNDYFFIYIKSPFTIIFFLLGLLVIAFYVTYEVSCLSVCFDAGYHNNPISVLSIFKSGVRLMKKTMKRKKLNSFFHVFFVAVMMNITLIVFFSSNITLPDSAVRAIKENMPLLIVAGVVLAAFFVYCLIHIFSINYMTYDGCDITESKRKSRQLVKRRGFKTLGTVACWNVMILVAIYAVYLVILMLICLGVYILDKVNIGMALYLTVFRGVVNVMKILLIMVSLPMTYCVITSLFYMYRCDSGNELNMGIVTEGVVKKKRKKHGKTSVNAKTQYIISGAIIAVVLSVNIVYLVNAFDENPFDNVEFFDETQVMAHRGSSYNAPENTMPAFENAVDAMADYIELDVHETKDGQIVVMHDSSLKRTTGVNKYIWDVNYDDISELDAGSWFGDEEGYAECRIPLLSDVMEYTKGKIKLNIEIKLTDSEPDLVKMVASLIERYEYTDDCVVTSMNYEALKEIKKINPAIKTGYVLTVAYGNFYNLAYVDSFSINSGFVNKNMVDAIHNRGKEIYVWTVNGENRAKELTVMGVDALITDNPVMAREVVYSKYSNTLIYNVLSYVFKN